MPTPEKHKLNQSQENAVEFISNGYQAGVIGANTAVTMMKDAGLTVVQRISQLETMAFKKGLAVAKNAA